MVACSCIQDQPEVKLTWRPRDDFETAEGNHEMGRDARFLGTRLCDRLHNPLLEVPGFAVAEEPAA